MGRGTDIIVNKEVSLCVLCLGLYLTNYLIRGRKLIDAARTNCLTKFRKGAGVYSSPELENRRLINFSLVNAAQR